MTQFLAKAQGMPKPITTALTKLTRDFIWDGRRSPPIGIDRLYLPHSKGGINLLNVQAQNDTIDVKDASLSQTYSFLPASWAGDTHEETDFLPIGDREAKEG